MYQEVRKIDMPRKVTAIGKGLGVVLPSEFIKATGLKIKDNVEMWTNGKELIVKPILSRLTIEERFAMYPADYIHDEELDWGADVGEEIICD